MEGATDSKNKSARADEPDTICISSKLLVLIGLLFTATVFGTVCAIVKFSDASVHLERSAQYDSAVVGALNDMMWAVLRDTPAAVVPVSEHLSVLKTPPKEDETFTLFNLTMTWRECGMLHTVVSLGTQKYASPSASTAGRVLYVGFSPKHAQLAALLLHQCRTLFGRPENWDYYPWVFPQPVLIESTSVLTRYSFLPDGLRLLE